MGLLPIKIIGTLCFLPCKDDNVRMTFSKPAGTRGPNSSILQTSWWAMVSQIVPVSWAPFVYNGTSNVCVILKAIGDNKCNRIVKCKTLFILLRMMPFDSLTLKKQIKCFENQKSMLQVDSYFLSPLPNSSSLCLQKKKSRVEGKPNVSLALKSTCGTKW